MHLKLSVQHWSILPQSSALDMIIQCFLQSQGVTMEYVLLCKVPPHAVHSFCVSCTTGWLGAGSQVQYMASSATPLLVHGLSDTGSAEEPAAGHLTTDAEQGALAQPSSQVCCGLICQLESRIALQGTYCLRSLKSVAFCKHAGHSWGLGTQSG